MNLVLTDPILDDYKAFHKLISEEGWQRQFHNYRGQTINETKEEIKYWVENGNKVYPSFLRMIKLTPYSNISEFNSSNSTLIGFISNVPAGLTDRTRTGFRMLMNFGIGKKYEGKGLMTMAMEMTLERLYQLGLNIVSAYVKSNNIGSERVLEKCGFDLIRNNGLGKTYVKALKIDMNEYRDVFGL